MYRKNAKATVKILWKQGYRSKKAFYSVQRNVFKLSLWNTGKIWKSL